MIKNYRKLAERRHHGPDILAMKSTWLIHVLVLARSHAKLKQCKRVKYVRIISCKNTGWTDQANNALIVDFKLRPDKMRIKQMSMNDTSGTCNIFTYQQEEYMEGVFKFSAEAKDFVRYIVHGSNLQTN